METEKLLVVKCRQMAEPITWRAVSNLDTNQKWESMILNVREYETDM